MCGLTGILDYRRQTSTADLLRQVQTMADSMVHRGPDSSGTWADGEQGIALGHRRLAIIDLSPAGHQPMISSCSRYVISYNGEVYNFAEMRERLVHSGHQFRGGSDTEVILAAFSEWGIERAVEQFIGMFAIALWDREKRQLTLIRDRVGIKPLYYGRVGGVFLFGSELQALRRHPQFNGSINRDALALFLARNYVPHPHSIYEGISKLPPGCKLTVSTDGTEPTLTRYWSLRDVATQGLEQPFVGDDNEARDELERLLSTAVRQRMVADVPLGVFLSGGIDSSAVAAIMQAQSDKPIKSFAIGYREADFNEAGYAESVARHLGADHKTFIVSSQDAIDLIPSFAQLLDEPFADPSLIPTYIVSKLARQETTVVLTGDGGDEVFGGYTRHVWSQKIANISGRLPAWSKGLISQAIVSFSPYQWDRVLRYLPKSLAQTKPGSKLHRFAAVLDSRDAGEVYRRVMNHWQQPELLVPGASRQPTILDRSADWPIGADPTSVLIFLDGMTYLPDNGLSKVDRASMAVGLEARVPLLDHRVVSFAWSLPLAYKIRDDVGKRVLRDVLYKHAPESLFDRPKMGFGVPVRDWLRGPLRTWADDLLSEERLQRQGYLDPQRIREKWSDHRSGRRDWYNQIWSALVFQAWIEAREL